MLSQLYFKFHCDGLSAPMQLYHSLIGLREAGKKLFIVQKTQLGPTGPTGPDTSSCQSSADAGASGE